MSSRWLQVKYNLFSHWSLCIFFFCVCGRDHRMKTTGMLGAVVLKAFCSILSTWSCLCLQQGKHPVLSVAQETGCSGRWRWWILLAFRHPFTTCCFPFSSEGSSLLFHAAWTLVTSSFLCPSAVMWLSRLLARGDSSGFHGRNSFAFLSMLCAWIEMCFHFLGKRMKVPGNYLVKFVSLKMRVKWVNCFRSPATEPNR